MLVLFETAAGYAIFKLLDERKLTQTENLYEDFETPERASQVVKLKHFEKFRDTTEALAATTACIEGKVSKSMKKVLKKALDDAGPAETLLVADSKLGSAIKDKFQLSCISNTSVQELMRCIRSQLDSLLVGLQSRELTAMALGLAHSLSRYKLKFSPDKVDTMVVQAVGLLDDLDKELNNYMMRAREWYGWHFPELAKIVPDNMTYVKVIQRLGLRENAANADLSDILSEEKERELKEAAEVSMGTEITEQDILNIQLLCEQVVTFHEYRANLYTYLLNRMTAIAPNLTILVGELVGARLIARAGSLMNLAKHPASTIQILGAEKALFRALKTRRDTPKYGLIYHSQLVGLTSPAFKGKISRMLAAKAALATRIDALGEDVGLEVAAGHKVKIENRLRVLEEGKRRQISGTGRSIARMEKYHSKSDVRTYPSAADNTLGAKRKIEEVAGGSSELEAKKVKKLKKGVKEHDEDDYVEESPAKKKKKKKQVEFGPAIEEVMEEPEEEIEGKKKKKKKKKAALETITEEEVGGPSTISPDQDEDEEEVAAAAAANIEKKKKKKKKKRDDE